MAYVPHTEYVHIERDHTERMELSLFCFIVFLYLRLSFVFLCTMCKLDRAEKLGAHSVCVFFFVVRTSGM